MASEATERGVYRFDGFEVQVAQASLMRAGRPVPIQRLPFALLVLLLEARGEVVTRAQIRARLWPDGTHVDFEHGVNTALKKLRRALGDSPRKPRYVETLPKRGMRFVAPDAPHDAAAALAWALERLERVPGFALAARGLAKRAKAGFSLGPDDRACLRDALAALLAASGGPTADARVPAPRAA